MKAIDCGIVVSEFEHQSRYYVHFQTNTLGKGMKSLIYIHIYIYMCVCVCVCVYVRIYI